LFKRIISGLMSDLSLDNCLGNGGLLFSLDGFEVRISASVGLRYLRSEGALLHFLGFLRVEILGLIFDLRLSFLVKLLEL
jgi:hypothetical protein